MNALKFIGLFLIQLVKQIWSLPKTIGAALKHKQQRMAHDKFETERLDRIRNPDKYLGK